MNADLMRWIDKWIGAPLCLTLSVLRKASYVFGRSAEAAKPERIAFLKLAEQGSTVLACDAMCEAVRRVGHDNVFFVAFRQNRFIVDVLNVIPEQNVVEIADDGAFKAFLGVFKALSRLRRERVDTIIDMEFFARSTAIIGFLSGARTRVGFHPYFKVGAYRGDLTTHRLHYNPRLHAADLFLAMVNCLDCQPGEFPAMDVVVDEQAGRSLPKFAAEQDEIEVVRQKVLDESGGKTIHAMVLLNANCSDLLPLRRWDSENYLELARRILHDFPSVHVVFTGGTDEAETGAVMSREVGCDRCFSMAGKTTLRELLILYGLARVLVTNDSGPAHFSSLTSVATVVLFGPESPKLFASRGERTHVLYAGLACSPCVSAFNDRRSRCRDNLCMQRITINAVHQKVCGLLNPSTISS